MDASAFVRGLLDDQEDPQQPQYVQANDFPARTMAFSTSSSRIPTRRLGML